MARATNRKNVFLLGYDEDHAEDMKQIPDVERFNFIPLLRSEDLINQKNLDFPAKLKQARAVLRDFDGPIDAIVCHWDFPATPLYAILCREHNLPAPSLEAVMSCSHKYWSRVEQRKAAPESTPQFCAIDPFDDDALTKVSVDYPYWMKPITGYSSMLGFRIDSDEDFKNAMVKVRQEIKRLGDPFNKVFELTDVPSEIAHVNGNYMIAEQLVSGREIAPEGYVQNGQFHAHGMVDMVQADNGKSFLRVEYPSTIDKSVQTRAIDVSRRVLQQIGYDNGCFNMEFFWNQETNDLWIIEINPRISQSHSYQFEQVDGMSNHEIAIHVALGDKPLFEHGSGPHSHAAKYWLRRYDMTDGIAQRIPETADFERLRNEQPDTKVNLKIRKGETLSDLLYQDAYSYVLAEVLVAADSVEEMDAKYERARELLPFEFSPVGGHERSAGYRSDQPRPNQNL